MRDATWSLPVKVGWGLMLALIVLLLLWSARYLTLDPAVYFERQRETYEAHTLGITLHIAGMIVAAAMGPFQFLRSFRNRHRSVHRLMGKFYIGGAVVGALGGLYMSQYAATGAVAGIGFALLAIGVLVTSGMAFRAIRARRVQVHREWMTRSFALILAAVTLRIYLPFLEAAFGEDTGYMIVAWLCWVPNLLVAELIVRGGRRVREPALSSA